MSAAFADAEMVTTAKSTGCSARRRNRVTLFSSHRHPRRRGTMQDRAPVANGNHAAARAIGLRMDASLRSGYPTGRECSSRKAALGERPSLPIRGGLMRFIRRALATLLVALSWCSAAAIAASFSTDQSDLWWANPPGSENGWGFQLVQRNFAIFATLFVYGPTGTPTW